MTTEYALNVRGRPPVQNRFSIGKRAGLDRAITFQAGESGARRINHLATMPKATDTPSAGTGRYVQVNQEFYGKLVQDYPDLGEELVVFLKKYQTVGHYVDVNYAFSVDNIDLDATDNQPLATTEIGGLILDWVSADGYPGIAATYGTTNDVTVCLHAAFQTTTDNDNVGNEGEPTNFGPFVRGAGDLGYFICACLLRDGADNKIKLAIIEVNGATRTTLVERSIPITLADQNWATSKGVGVYGDLCIRCWATATTVSASVVWPTVGLNTDTEGTPNFQITVNNTTNASYTRGGGFAPFTVTTNPTGSDTDNRWHIKSIAYTKFVPNDPDEAYRLTRAAGVISPPPLRYYMPSTAVGVSVTTGGTVTTFTGTSQNTLPGAPALDTQAIPEADQTGGFVAGGATTSKSKYIVPTTSWPELYAVETRGKADPGSAAHEDIMGAAFRVRQSSAAYDSAILIEVKHTGSAEYARARFDRFESMRVVQVLAGARSTLTSISTSNANNPPFRSEHWHRWAETGSATPSAVDLTWAMNGVTIKTFAAVGSSWNSLFNTPGNVVGSCFYGDTALGGGFTDNTYAFGMRLVDTTNSSATVVSETECRYAAFTTGYVDVGVIQDNTLQRCAGVGLSNPVVSSAVLGKKWYAVDGLASKVISPEDFTVADWTATAGTFPEKCRVVAAFRRSIVLARQSSDPSIYYISRTDDPTDWDFGADPEATSPIAGNNGSIGQPADPINALIPFDNDMLWLGHPSAITRIEGDPRSGGQLQVLTRSTGVVGPRAWCFDGRGSLWFIGIDGLYRYTLGGSMENVSGSRLVDLIDHLDAESLFVQLAYDPYSKCLLIFRTPVDGVTVGTAIAYDTENNAFWMDQYPLDQGPWSVAQPFASNPTQRRPLLGGNDGYIRWHSDSATDDDGTSIATGLDVFVTDAAGGMIESMVERLESTLSVGSATVDWKWFTASSPEAVAALTSGEASSGQWTGGYNAPSLLRCTGGSHKLRISQTSDSNTWAIERINAVFLPRGRRR